MAIEIVDLPTNSMVILNSYVSLSKGFFNQKNDRPWLQTATAHLSLGVFLRELPQRTRDGTQEICGVFCHLKSEYPGVILIGYENMYIIQIYSHSDMKIQILIYSHSDLLATTHLQCLQSGSSFLYLPYPCVTVSPEMFRWFLSKSRTVKCWLNGG